jgi:LysM domain-containing protein
MTRETKIGMVVAVSFLSLVGLVVVAKWRGGATPTANLAQNGKPGEKAPAKSAAPEGNPPTNSPVVQAGGANLRASQIESNPPMQLPKNTQEATQPLIVQPIESSNVPSSNPSSSNPASVPLPAPPTVSSNLTLPPAPNTSEERLKNLQTQIKQDGNTTLPALPVLPSASSTLPLPPPPLPEPAKKIDDAIAGAFGKIDEAQNKAAKTVDSAILKGNDELNKGLDRANVAVNKGNDFVNQKIDASINRANQGIDKTNAAANNAVQSGVNKLDNLLGKLDNNINKGLDSANRGLDNLNSKLTLPPPAAVEIGVGSASLPPITNSNTGGANPPPVPMAAPQNSFPAIPAPTAIDVRPTIPAPSNPLPMVAANNSGFTIPAPGKNSEVRVTSDAVRNYQIRGGETFAALSKAYYGSEKYASALQAFNRDFTPNLNPSNLQPGQMVRIPSEQFLQERYASALSPSLGSATVAAIGTAPVSINPPVPVASTRPTAPPPPTADPTKSYRVPAQGQFIFEIARQTMSDGNRWSEIYRLNPMVDPTQPIPGNTILRLPSNANVP